MAFDPESIQTYEIGVRSDLVGGRLRLNASLFHTDWEDIQIRSNFVDPSIGVYAVTIITQNVAGADADGRKLREPSRSLKAGFAYELGTNVVLARA